MEHMKASRAVRAGKVMLGMDVVCVVACLAFTFCKCSKTPTPLYGFVGEGSNSPMKMVMSIRRGSESPMRLSGGVGGSSHSRNVARQSDLLMQKSKITSRLMSASGAQDKSQKYGEEKSESDSDEHESQEESTKKPTFSPSSTADSENFDKESRVPGGDGHVASSFGSNTKSHPSSQPLKKPLNAYVRCESPVNRLATPS